jgi:hypothetical protein
MNARTKKRQQGWEKILPQLQLADIILTHDERSLLSASIRKVTDSYWNHVVIVFSVPTNKKMFNNTLVIGAETHGIEIHRLQRYTNHFDYIDVGVKRVPGLSEEIRQKVISYVTNHIDIPYDYTRLFGFIVNAVENFFKKGNAHLRTFLTNRDAFVCSSFVQKAFFEAVPPQKKNGMIFKNGFDALSSLEEVNPADIARSKNCEWIYNPHD